MSPLNLNKNTVKDELLHGFCASLYIFPLSLSVGVLSGVGVFAGAFVGAVGCLLAAFCGVAFAPCWMLFMPAFFAIKEFGTGFTFFAMLSGAVLFALLQNILQKKQIKPVMMNGAAAGLAIGAAFLATVILTKDYFGIAAAGNTAMEMLRSYRSNGFHANWRGVLYGTITLVIMITWPRKFRHFKRYLPAPFVALLIPLGINMILNYEAYRTPVYETGNYAFTDLKCLFDLSSNPHSWLLLPVVAVGFCVAYFAAYLFFHVSAECIKEQVISHFVSSAVGLPMQPYTFGPKTILGGVVGALSVVGLSCAFPLVTRMPTHSMAVVLITLGWQSVPWGKIKAAFKAGPIEITAFLLCFACFVFADPIAAFLPPLVSCLDLKKSK